MTRQAKPTRTKKMIAERMPVPGQKDADIWDGLHLFFPAGEASTRLTLHKWRSAMETAGICPDVTARAEIVLAEVLNNIAEHGQQEGRIGWVDLRCDICPSGLQVVVADQGRPMPPHLLSPPQETPCPRGDVSLSDLPEGGFGWAIIRCLTCDLHLQSHEGGNTLSFVIPYCGQREQALGHDLCRDRPTRSASACGKKT